MSYFPLLLALRATLAPALAALPMTSRPGRDPGHEPDGLAAVPIHIGQLPARQRPDMGPFVLLQPISGQRESGLDSFDVAIRLGVYNYDEEACENDLANLISAIRLHLFELPGGCLGGSGSGAWRLCEEADNGLHWERPDGQAQPYLEAYIMARFQTIAAIKNVTPRMVDYE